MNAAELQTQLDAGMNERLHWFPEAPSLEALAETMAAMANGNGGQIFLGIAPRSGQRVGLADPETAVDLAHQAALQLDPSLPMPSPTLTAGSAPVVIIQIPADLPQVYNLGGRYPIRSGRQNHALADRALRELLVTRGSIHFESQVPPQATFSDLDPDLIDEYLTMMPATGTGTEEGLVQRGCASPSPDGYLPTFAGLLLFGRNPQRWLPNASLLAARFTGAALSDEYVKQEIAGPLPHQIRTAEQFCRDQLHTSARLEGLVRSEKREYPLEAIRELVVNAVAHRDYHVRGDGVHVHIFADRFEVHSPGELPGPVNLDNLLVARFSRNPMVVQVLSDMGYIERLGYGLDRVIRVAREHGLPLPHFEEVGGTFRVTLQAAPRATRNREQATSAGPTLAAMNLNQRQLAALEHMAIHQRITNSKYQELCPEVHTETLRRDLVDLVTRGLLLKIGNRKSTYYILK